MSLFQPAPTPAAPPPPPILANVAETGERIRAAAAAAAGKAGFGRTIKTSAQGATSPAKTKAELQPEMHFSQVFGG